MMNQNKKELELANIQFEKLNQELEKLHFDFKMLKNSLERKIKYYDSKYKILVDPLEKDNVCDIMEKCEFDIKYEEKKLELEARMLNLKIKEQKRIIDEIIFKLS